MLNKEFLTEEICKILYNECYYDGEKPSHIDNVNDLHDIAIRVIVGDFYIEEYDALYWEMCSLIEQETDYIIDCVNEFIDEKSQSYYGDPAFASAGDYWEYILG